MSEGMISALVQAPFVLAIVYVVLRILTYLNVRDREWRAFIEHRDRLLAEHLDELNESVRELANLVVTHDAVMRAAVLNRPQESGAAARQAVNAAPEQAASSGTCPRA
ncbi:MAG: hypothetical protein Kow00124_24130 [Anaerolineae bacterium]